MIDKQNTTPELTVEVSNQPGRKPVLELDIEVLEYRIAPAWPLFWNTPQPEIFYR